MTISNTAKAHHDQLFGERVSTLATTAMLAGIGGADAQIRGHVTGNLNVGNSRARLLAVLTVLVPFIGYPNPQRARRHQRHHQLTQPN